MLKKIISVLLAALLCTPYAASAANSDTPFYGFDTSVSGTTETVNEYFFDDTGVILVENKEAYTDFDYEEIYAGSYLLLPLKVYIDGGSTATPVTDKMLKSDNVTFSYKVMRGINYVEELSIVDGKKLKLNGVAAGSYIKIPFVSNYPHVARALVSVQLVLSVNDITYEFSQTSFNCRIKPYITEIRHNAVYGAKSPTLFRTDKKYQGEVTFDFGNDIKYTANVKKNSLYFLNLSREQNKDIADMYPGAYLEFYNFIDDKDTFHKGGRLEIPVKMSNMSKKGQSASLYVYRIDDQTLTALALGVVSFNKNTSKLTINTTTLGNYVISNQPLNRNVTSADSDILKSGYADQQTP